MKTKYMQSQRKQKTTPLVSIIMPAFNAERFIVDAVESILNQTYQNFELIIVDDASTDGTLAIVRNYQKQYPEKIKVVSLHKNRNSGGDRCANVALSYAKGTYIARMDADDIAYPTRLAKQVAFLSSHPDVFLVGASADVIDEDGSIIGEKNEPTSDAAIKKLFFTVHPLIHPTCMYRRILPPLPRHSRENGNLEKHSGSSIILRMTKHKRQGGKPFRYAIRYNANNDYYTFFKLLSQGYIFANLPEKLLYYRVHTKSATFTNLKKNFMNTLKIRIRMMRKFGYQASVKDLLTLSLQTAIVLPLPNALLTNLYILARGFHKPQVMLSRLQAVMQQTRFVLTSSFS